MVIRPFIRPYHDVLRLPGAAAFSGAGLLARLPLSMVGLGIVLLVADRTGSYGLAGLLVATFGVVNAAAAPTIGRLVDRYGQRRVVPAAVTLHGLGLLALLVLVDRGAPTPALLAAAGVAGAGFPPTGALVRSRWSTMLGGDPRLNAAFAWESVLDEVVFLVGPTLVTVLAITAAPTTALLTTLALMVAGMALLLAQRRTEPAARPAPGGRTRSVLRDPALQLVVVMMLAMGAVFGTVEVVTVAFADDREVRAAAGLVLSVYAGGSLVAGLAYGGVAWRVSPARRLAAGSVLMAVTLVPLLLVDSVGALTVVVFVAGSAIAPTLITAFAIVERVVPGARLTEGLTWAGTGLSLGVAGGAPLAGHLVDTYGTRAGFGVTVASGLLTAAVGVLGGRRLGTALRRAGPAPGKAAVVALSAPPVPPPGGRTG